MSDISKALGERIRELRLERGLSQEQLALKAELNISFVGQIERGLKSPTITSLEKLVAALEVRFEDIFTFAPNIAKKDTTVIDKIAFKLSDRTADEQEEIYRFIKQLLAWKDR